MKIIHINNREKKKRKGRRKKLLTYFSLFVSWNGAEIKVYE